MTGKLEKHGQDLALIIDEAILKRFHIDENTPLEINANEQGLTIVFGRKKKLTLNEAMSRTNQRYSEVFRRLAE